jgi:hypothetical protein
VEGATKSDLGENWLYTDGQLYKNTVTDEDGNKTTEFKNGQGQTIMVKKKMAAALIMCIMNTTSLPLCCLH